MVWQIVVQHGLYISKFRVLGVLPNNELMKRYRFDVPYSDADDINISGIYFTVHNEMKNVPSSDGVIVHFQGDYRKAQIYFSFAYGSPISLGEGGYRVMHVNGWTSWSKF